MKWHRLFIPAMVLFAVLAILWGVSSGRADPSKNPAQPEMPELPPPIPPDCCGPEILMPTTPPLAHELTEQEALERVFELDSQGVDWVDPWSLATLEEDKNRITINLYNSRSEASKAVGLDMGFSPDVEADAGKVWVVSIKGTANASNLMMHMPEDELVDGVTYFVSARTGHIIGMHTPHFKE